MDMINTMLMETFLCPHCEGRNDKKSGQRCRHCNKNMTIGRLVSRGCGVLPKNEEFFLLPTVMRLGSDPRANDFVIESHSVAARQCRFVLEEEGFSIVDPKKSATVNGEAIPRQGTLLNNGDIVKIVDDEFEYYYPYMPEESGLGTETIVLQEVDPDSALMVARDIEDIVQKQLLILAAILTEANRPSKLQKIFTICIDAVADLTNMNRGYGFIVNPDGENEVGGLQEIVARWHGKILNPHDHSKNYRIHDGLLNLAHETMEIIIAGEDNPELRDRDVKYKAVMCIPICTYDDTMAKQVRGIMYADSLTDVELDENTEILLQIVAKILGLAMAKADSMERLERMSEIMAEMEEIIREHIGDDDEEVDDES